MTRTLSSLLTAAFLVLAGCGGGSSSDGGGSSDSATGSTSDAAAPSGSDSGSSSTGDENSVAGTYVGTGTASVSGGGFSESADGPVQIVIRPDNTVAFGEPGEPPVGTTSLNPDGRSFDLVVPSSFFNEPGFNCTGSVNASGAVNGDALNGSIAGNDVACNGIPFSLTGTFNLDKTDARARSGTRAGLWQSLQAAMAGIGS
ncbi:MAG TPA: hypothetical protein VK973_10610 [Arenicellales bacterium]|nr:hypothetical protein [Arenicellales bacterium]